MTQRYRLAEGSRWFEQFLALPESRLVPEERARSLTAAGEVTYWRTDYPRATELFEEALVAYRDLNDERGIASVCSALGNCEFDAGNVERAEELVRHAVEAFGQLGDRFGFAVATGLLGRVVLARGSTTEARSLYSEALAISEELGNNGWKGYMTESLGFVGLLAGDEAASRRAYEDALTIARAMSDEWRIASCLFGFAELARRANHPRRAVRLFAARGEDPGGARDRLAPGYPADPRPLGRRRAQGTRRRGLRRSDGSRSRVVARSGGNGRPAVDGGRSGCRPGRTRRRSRAAADICRTDPARGRGAATDRGGVFEPRDRRSPVHQPPDGDAARGKHPRQTRGRFAHRRRRACASPGSDRAVRAYDGRSRHGRLRSALRQEIHRTADARALREWHPGRTVGVSPAEHRNGLRCRLHGRLAMSGLEGLIFALVAVVVLDVLSLRFGRDSRSSSDPRRDWN